jgi:hypothetical protein
VLHRHFQRAIFVPKLDLGRSADDYTIDLALVDLEARDTSARVIVHLGDLFEVPVAVEQPARVEVRNSSCFSECALCCEARLSSSCEPRPSVSDESTFCLQCWHVYSLIRRQFIRGEAKHQGEQQRSCQCDERDSQPDLVIQAAPTHLGTRLYELTG